MRGLSTPEALFALVMCFGGTLIQGAIGFGFAFAAVPALLLVAPEAVPATPLLLAVPLVATMALRERQALDVHGFLQVTAGRVPGTVAGAWIVSALGASLLTGVVGGLLLLAALLSLVATSVRLGARERVAAGFVSGIMGTAGAIGGPALGLAYQGHPAPVLRATLATAFAVGVVLSLAALALTGEIGDDQAVLALELLPAVVLGLWAGRRLGGRLPERRVRPIVLAFAAAAGAAAILRSAL